MMSYETEVSGSRLLIHSESGPSGHHIAPIFGRRRTRVWTLRSTGSLLNKAALRLSQPAQNNLLAVCCRMEQNLDAFEIRHRDDVEDAFCFWL